jgi:hypothetical protein
MGKVILNRGILAAGQPVGSQIASREVLSGAGNSLDMIL